MEYIYGKWYICDGNGIKNSTNGTWVFIEDPMRIYDGMIFKAGQLLFRAKLIGKPRASIPTTSSPGHAVIEPAVQ